MRDVVALWYVGARTAGDIVRAACDLLVAGEGGLAVAELAAVPYRHADEEVPLVLAAALAELGIPCHERGSREADLAGLRAVASRVVAGETAPDEFAHWAHTTFGHHGVDEAQPLVRLSDEYEYRTAIEAPADDLDEQTIAEVGRLLG
ncbi:hypothetical protein JCM33774_44010 [Actinophytocola sp. KF-1]